MALSWKKKWQTLYVHIKNIFKRTKTLKNTAMFCQSDIIPRLLSHLHTIRDMWTDTELNKVRFHYTVPSLSACTSKCCFGCVASIGSQNNMIKRDGNCNNLGEIIILTIFFFFWLQLNLIELNKVNDLQFSHWVRC